jgi:hypothetical protein
MSVSGMKVKNGVRYVSFACSANRSRGAAICPNSSSIGERSITTMLLDALRETLTAPAVVDALVAGFEQRMAERKAKPKASDLERQLRDAEQRVANAPCVSVVAAST